MIGHEHSDAPDQTSPSIRVFDGVGVVIAGGPVDIGGPRQRRLSALLAMRAGSLADVDWLAEYLWDDHDRPEAPTLPLTGTIDESGTEAHRGDGTAILDYTATYSCEAEAEPAA